MRSPAADFVGLASSRPVAVTRWPSSASTRAAAPSDVGVGSAPVPRMRTSASVGRISSWPYGAASLPATSSRVPRASDPSPDAPRTTSPPSASPIASRAGVPSRPGSATIDAGRPHARAERKGSDSAQRRDIGRWASGSAWASASRSASRWGVASAWRSVPARLVGVGVALARWASGRPTRSAWASGVGAGVASASSPVERRLDPVAAGARPGAVSLPERAGHRRQHPGRDRLAAKGIRPDDGAERTGSIVDRDRRARPPAGRAIRRRCRWRTRAGPQPPRPQLRSPDASPPAGRPAGPA